MNETIHENSDTVGQIVNYIMKNEGTVLKLLPLKLAALVVVFYNKYVFSDSLTYGMFTCFDLITNLFILSSLKLSLQGSNFKDNREVSCLLENCFVW